MSRISYVTTYPVAYPLDQALSDSIHYMPVRAALLVEMGTDDGKVGIGESAIYGGPASVYPRASSASPPASLPSA